MNGQDWSWRRVTGWLGIAFFVGIAIGLFGLVLPTQPDADAPIAEVRDFFEDDGGLLHSGNWIAAVSVVFLFLPFAAGLRSVLSERDVDAGMWTRTGFGAAVGTVALTGAGSAFLTSAELAFESADLGDDVLRLLLYADSYLFSVVIGLGVGLYLAANSIVVLRTGALWRWLGWFGLVVAALGLIGAWWPLGGDVGSPIALLSFITVPLLAVWTLLAGINLLRTSE
jgi:hypothetical protein